MKREWRKHEKEIYVPKQKPQIIEVPEFRYLTIKGEGNPNNEEFSKCIEALYSLSYGVRMSYKWDEAPEGYYEYTVYPLEGFWDLKDKSKGNEPLDKDNLVYEIMIRQPDFATEELIEKVKEVVKSKKKVIERIDDVEFKSIKEGKCLQMLHIGSYDNEPETFEKMEQFCEENGLERESKVHKEIYLSDFRKTAPEKLKTVLRFKLK